MLYPKFTLKRQSHIGRYFCDYCNFGLRGMEDIQKAAKGSQGEFLLLFANYVMQPILDNPELLSKSGWK